MSISTIRDTNLKKGGKVHKLSVESSYKLVRESVDLTEMEERKSDHGEGGEDEMKEGVFFEDKFIRTKVKATMLPEMSTLILTEKGEEGEGGAEGGEEEIVEGVLGSVG